MDLIYEGITTNNPLTLPMVAIVRMDLIYEGITTEFFLLILQTIRAGQNGPDLRRDYDFRRPISFFISFLLVRMDLIYEGITTTQVPNVYVTVVILSEWTWFTKGLRLASSCYN